MCSERKVFGSFSLSGGRFDQADGLPVSAVGEIQTYDKLIRAVAGALYKRDHPSKKKLPNGFMDKLDMHITSIEHGCVKVGLDAALGYVQPDMDYSLQPADYFEEARLSVKDAIKQIKADGNAEKVINFPSDGFSLLYKLGAKLNSKEKISLAESDDSDAVELDDSWREIVQSGLDECLFKERILLGQVTGVNTNEKENWYTFRTFDKNEKLRGTLSEEQLKDFKSFFDSYHRAPSAAVSVVVKIDKKTGVKNIEQTYSIEKALPSPLLKRVKELSELRDGWFDPPSNPGKAPSEQILDTLESLLTVLVDHELVDPLVSPRPDGGLEIEWENNDYEIALNPGGSIDAYNLSDARDDDGQRTFSVTDSEESIVSWLKDGRQQ